MFSQRVSCPENKLFVNFVMVYSTGFPGPEISFMIDRFVFSERIPDPEIYI